MLESVYQKALYRILQKQGLHIKKEVPVPVYFEEEILDDTAFKIDLWVENAVLIDLWVENAVLIELKSVEVLSKLHHKQILTYLKLTNLKLGILVNFNTENISSSIFRKVNNLPFEE
jgi:hypothetical protein